MGINILLVDDHQTVRDGLKFILSQDSDIDEVREAYSGNQAIIKVSENIPDVIVLDYEMPVLNGVLTAKYLVKDPNW